MQDPKKVNVSNAVVANGKIYSIEFHQDNHDTNVKVVDGGVATYYPIGGSGSSKTYEYWENTSNGPQSVSANIIAGLVNDGLGANTSSNTGTLYDGSRFDFSSLAIGSVVSITLQTALAPTTQNSYDFTIWFTHETDNGTKQFSFVTDETRTQGRPVTHTITLPIIDATMRSGVARFYILSAGDLTLYNNFVSISVL
jgi:hypothetical protein